MEKKSSKKSGSEHSPTQIRTDEVTRSADRAYGDGEDLAKEIGRQFRTELMKLRQSKLTKRA